MVPASALAGWPAGRRVAVAGLVLVRQRPATASGVVFVTLEDEAGMANLVLWPSVFARDRIVVRSATLLGACGRVQREDTVVHLIADPLRDLSGELGRLAAADGGAPAPAGTEQAGRPGHHPREAFPEARNFR